MEIIKKLSAEFKIKLSAEKLYTLLYFLRLKLQVFFVIKTDLFHALLRSAGLRRPVEIIKTLPLYRDLTGTVFLL